MLTGVARRLTAGELAREPRSLGVIAWFDGWHRGQYPNAKPEHRTTYPRRLTVDEAEDWREGFAEGRRSRLCHAAHGFAHHTESCPVGIAVG